MIADKKQKIHRPLKSTGGTVTLSSQDLRIEDCRQTLLKALMDTASNDD